MAIYHATPCRIIDLKQSVDGHAAMTTTLIKTGHLEVIRLVIPAGKVIPPHQVHGEITVYCLEGRVEFNAMGLIQELKAANMLYLPGGERHSVKGLEDAIVLVTIQLAHSS